MGLGALEKRLGHTFGDQELLRRAMCHRSWVAESNDHHSNERLEFPGDAVLGWVTADLVFDRYGDLAEGALTDLRKSGLSPISRMTIEKRHQIAGISLGSSVSDQARSGPATAWSATKRHAP